MIYPAVCLWRRYAKNGGGEWAVGGTAYSLKKWVKVQGTFEGETIEDCKNWLKLRGYPLSSNTQFKLGQGGVYVLKGTQEGQWLRAWAETIRSAVNARVVHGKILPLGPQRVDPSRLVDVVNLDGF
ncbi:hypothetical protein FRC02_011983 [Tulasnella sp. 418]|nr:hypothetical protein FRC02_011983 [Tulasnella sp. 418]